MFIPDLSEPDADDPARRHLFVGWLDGAHPFTRGDVDSHFLDRLWAFADLAAASADALDWGARGGFHTCEICDTYAATGEFGVAGDEALYVAPTMVAHYVEKHGYSPPGEFVDAVMRCPLPGTPQYAAIVDRYHWRHDPKAATLRSTESM